MATQRSEILRHSGSQKVITDFTQDYQVEPAEVLLLRKRAASYANVGEVFTMFAGLSYGCGRKI